MYCIKCGGKTNVLEGVATPQTYKVIRERRCPACGERFFTEEVVAEQQQKAHYVMRATRKKQKKEGERKTVRIRVTEDREHANEVRKALKANDGYCPCQIKKTPDTKCICREFREQESGECLCGLYIKVEE